MEIRCARHFFPVIHTFLSYLPMDIAEKITVNYIFMTCDEVVWGKPPPNYSTQLKITVKCAVGK